MADRLDVGSGLGIRRADLRLSVHDPALFAATIGRSSDPPDVLLTLVLTGRLQEALRLVGRVEAAAGSSFRWQVLAGDVFSVAGEHDEAVARHGRLVAESLGGPREAVARQHLGKSLFAAGHLQEARTQFRTALAQRRADGAAPDLVASSRMALDRTEELLRSEPER